jgi:hypothetical protein
VNVLEGVGNSSVEQFILKSELCCAREVADLSKIDQKSIKNQYCMRDVSTVNAQ